MDRVPPELVYVVCSLLDDVDDILNFRLVSKLFADIGATYMLPEVTLYMHQDEFDRLRAISLHPIFAKHVSSLTYFAATLDSPKVSWREFVRDHKGRMKWSGRLRKLNLSPAQLMGEYKKYCDAVEIQDELMLEQKDVDVLKEVLPRFPKLETLTMSAGNYYYEGRPEKERKKPFDDVLRSGFPSGIHPEGKRPLESLLVANAHSPCALTELRAGSLHWRFFKRSERELAHMFRPLANLTTIELTISVDPADERINEGNSLRKCQRLLAKGAIRQILKSMPQLECLFFEVLNLECDQLERGACLKDVIEPGFHWPNLTELVLGGIVGDREDFMRVLIRHKDKLQKLCLRDVTLENTSWRKFLPDIRNNLNLEDACICGNIFGQAEDADDTHILFDDPLQAPGFEEWELSVPEVGAHNMRQSINMYCRQGGHKYPDEIPLCEFVVNSYYREFVAPHFTHEEEFIVSNFKLGDVELDGSEGEDDGNWEDVSEDGLDDDVIPGGWDNLFADDSALAIDMLMSGLEPPLPGWAINDDDEIYMPDPWDAYLNGDDSMLDMDTMWSSDSEAELDQFF
ncbi:hypothetical protein F4808DRAFT_423761 [Astrocystis sublimbata]|nr:hypothetical protein F4808DRAFT_423761 [Astrocystis sublimbata]